MKKLLYCLLVLILAVVVTACGDKTNKDIRSELKEKVLDMSGYKVEGVMNIKVGSVPQTYHVEVWYQSPKLYRVNLKNENKEQSQIILRNKEGVYVLTPALNKSFHFQSEWPENGGQAYLYQSLVQDILNDKKSKFKETKSTYVFETKTRYANNKALPIQEITFNKDSLAPKKVVVMDVDRNKLVTVAFSKMIFNPKFGSEDFDVKKNMTGAQLEIPDETKDTSFTVKYPTVKIQDAVQTDEKTIEAASGKQVVLTFTGKVKNFTLIESKAEISKAVSSILENGDPIDLGFTVGTITDHTISWTYEGVDFLLASNNLSKEELITVAGSVLTNGEK